MHARASRWRRPLTEARLFAIRLTAASISFPTSASGDRDGAVIPINGAQVANFAVRMKAPTRHGLTADGGSFSVKTQADFTGKVRPSSGASSGWTTPGPAEVLTAPIATAESPMRRVK
jgi:hypothetical protein